VDNFFHFSPLTAFINLIAMQRVEAILARPFRRVVDGVRCLSTKAKVSVSVDANTRPKHKVPFKRASSLLGQLRQEEFEKLRAGREWPAIRAGDSIQLDHLPNISSKEPVKMRGVVISKVNRSSDSAVTILNVEGGTPVERRIPLYSPMVTSVSVLQNAFIHKGKKRVRRSKLYYLRDRKPEEFTVPYPEAVVTKKAIKK
jgi:large subunit ribosomal protein L19